jgi:hypothetical protein
LVASSMLRMVPTTRIESSLPMLEEYQGCDRIRTRAP